MKSTLIALDAEALTDEQRRAFIDNFASMLYSGKGSTSTFSRQVGVSEADALRVFLGLPAASLGWQQRRIFEAMYAYTLGLPVMPRPELWTDEPTWMPVNPDRNADRPIGECELDLEFIKSFGIRRGVWEKEILMADLSALASKIVQGGDLSVTNMRLYMALAIFGFRDPSQFFV